MFIGITGTKRRKMRHLSERGVGYPSFVPSVGSWLRATLMGPTCHMISKGSYKNANLTSLYLLYWDRAWTEVMTRRLRQGSTWRFGVANAQWDGSFCGGG